MTDKDWRHETVNTKRLSSLKIGKSSGEYQNSGVHLFDEPLKEYINENEKPRFILAARKKAPKISGPNRPTWSGNKVNGMPMHVVTDNRWLIVVGQRAGDSTFEIEFEDITSIDYDTGLVGHKIHISTNSNDIEIPISNTYDEELLKLVTEYVRSPTDFTPEDHESIITDSKTNNRPRSDRLINKARHESVDKKRLTELKSGLTGRYLYDKPLIEYLKDDEQPHYILEGDFPINFSGPNPPENTGTESSNKLLNLVTDKRWIITQANESGDCMWEILYKNIDNIEVQSSKAALETIFIDTEDFNIEIGQLINQPTDEAVNYVRKVHLGEEDSDSGPDPIQIIDLSANSDDNLYAKLIVPTKSSGATFTSRGWNIGGNIVRGTSSKGNITEDNWENYVKELKITQTHIEIGITHGDLSMTSDNQIHQTIRVPLSEISDIRTQRVEGSTGFIFETEGDVYQFKLTRKGTFSTASQSDANGAVNSLQQAIEDLPDDKEKSTTKNNKQTNESNDPVNKLSQIKELHDQGVLNDDEFEKKKKELLDQI